MNIFNKYDHWILCISFLLCILNCNDLFAQEKSNNSVWQLAYVEIGGSTNVNEFFLNYSEPVNCSFVNGIGQRSSHTLTRFDIPVSDIKGEPPLLLKDFRQMLNAGSHPYIYIEMTDNQLSNIETNKTNQHFDFYVTINGIKRKCDGIGNTFYDRDNGVTTLNGSTNLLLSNFDLKAPQKFWGIIKVRNEVNIRFRLIFTSELNAKLGAL